METRETIDSIKIPFGVARSKLARIVADLVKERNGMFPPKREREAAAKPLTAYLDEFVRNLTARGKTPEYVYYIKKRLQKLLAACRWTSVSFGEERFRCKLKCKFKEPPRTASRRR